MCEYIGGVLVGGLREWFVKIFGSGWFLSYELINKVKYCSKIKRKKRRGWGYLVGKKILLMIFERVVLGEWKLW